MKALTAEELTAQRIIAVHAVEAGMRVAKDWRERGADLQVQETDAASEYDRYVTTVDQAAEAAISQVLRSHDAEAVIVGDEPVEELPPGLVWVVDPIDGTTNLVNGKTFVAVAVSLLQDGKPVVGATGCPFTDELWSAAAGIGTFDRSGERVTLHDRPTADRKIALDPATATPGQEAWWSDAHRRAASVCGEVAPRASIALALAYVAGGRFDGFVQFGGSQAQDLAAGVLLITQAGGKITGLEGREDVWNSGVVIAGTPETYKDLKSGFQGFSENLGQS
jgi:myo-inositol-1(or 4)-monophosphatase